MNSKLRNKIKSIKWLYAPFHYCFIELNRIPVKIAGWFRMHGLFLNENYKELLKYENKHKGERCFLVANGPSLRPEDLDKLKYEYTFGCNKIFYMFEKTEWRPTYYCILDETYIEKFQDEIFSHIDIPIFTNNVIAERITPRNKKGKKIVYSHQIYYSRFKAWHKLMNYTYGTKQGTIMSFVTAVALYMGFSEIYFLGLDNTGTTAGNHFYSSQTDASLQESLERRIKENGWSASHWENQTEIEMAEFQKYAKRNNIKILNATRGGKLEVFTRINLDDCFQ